MATGHELPMFKLTSILLIPLELLFKVNYAIIA